MRERERERERERARVRVKKSEIAESNGITGAAESGETSAAGLARGPSGGGGVDARARGATGGRRERRAAGSSRPAWTGGRGRWRCAAAGRSCATRGEPRAASRRRQRRRHQTSQHPENGTRVAPP